jgi:hypothetical protein
VSPVQGPQAGSLKTRIGAERAKQLLLGSPADRLRGIERLGLDGGDDAIKALVSALESGGAVRVNPQARLEAVRALAPHAIRDEARRGLEIVLGDSVEEGADAPIAQLARDTAALALARAGAGLVKPPRDRKPQPIAAEPRDEDDKDEDKRTELKKTPEELAATPLVAQVIAAGEAAESARRALCAHPPHDLLAFLRGSRKLPLAQLELLGAMGDARALPLLRRQLERKNRHAQIGAAMALARLADHSVLPLARKWLKDKKSEVAMRAAAVEILMRLDAPEAAVELTKLLAAAATRTAAFELAEEWLSPAIVPTLAAILAAPVLPEEKRRTAVLLSRIATGKAVAPLTTLLSDATLANTAIFGIAGIAGEEADEALTRALAASTGAAKRMVMRAAIVRHAKLGEVLPGLIDALETAMSSKEPSDRALGAYGLAVLGKKTVRELVASAHEEIVFAAASAAASLGPKALAELGPLVAKAAAQGEKASPGLLAASAGALLVLPEAASTADLTRWAEAGEANAALAAYRLAVRDPRMFRPRLDALFAGTDNVVRIHVALGLGLSPEADAVSRLVAAYRKEGDVEVRRAIVRALSLRSERLREATLRLAADLDPDEEIRGLAASSLRGLRHGLSFGSGREVGWLSLVANDPAHADTIAARPVWAIRSDGFALPLVSPPDGVVLALGLPQFGDVKFRVLPLE